MNPFVNPKKRSVSLPNGCKDLADVLGRTPLTTTSPIRRFITLLLVQAQQDGASELIVGVAAAGGTGTPIRYKVEGCWHDMSPFPSHIRARVVSELGSMAGLRRGHYPKDGVLSVPLPSMRLTWRVQIASRGAECVLTKTDA
jgi:type II secretory ATPase GspE/PulE/Tfp pilus assembly ATPase PilB-like protein